MAEARRLLIWLDPGHGTLKRDGARDTGAADTSGLGTRLCEKDLVLAAALRARDLLTAQGHEARLTHQRADYSEVMSYSERGALAGVPQGAVGRLDLVGGRQRGEREVEARAGVVAVRQVAHQVAADAQLREGAVAGGVDGVQAPATNTNERINIIPIIF